MFDLIRSFRLTFVSQLVVLIVLLHSSVCLEVCVVCSVHYALLSSINQLRTTVQYKPLLSYLMAEENTFAFYLHYKMNIA